MSPRNRIKMALALLVLLATVPVSASAQVCSPQVLNAVRKDGTAVDMQALDLAMARLKRIESLVGEETWDRVARATVNVIDPQLGSAQRVTIHKWVQTTLKGTDEEMARVIRAVDSFRDSEGELRNGLILKPGFNDESSTWIISAATGNRGHLFEVVGAENLVNEGFVNKDNIIGFGKRFRDQNNQLLIEADLAEQLPSGGVRAIDFKARDGHWEADRLGPAAQAVLNGQVEEVVYAYESGNLPSDDWIAEFNSQNAVLQAAGKNKMRLKASGTF